MFLDPFIKISIGIVIYTITLFLMKKYNIWKKEENISCNNCCPKCDNPLERIKRKKTDHLKNYFTLQIFDFKRFKCLKCSWEGIRWDRPFSSKF